MFSLDICKQSVQSYKLLSSDELRYQRMNLRGKFKVFLFLHNMCDTQYPDHIEMTELHV